MITNAPEALASSARSLPTWLLNVIRIAIDLPALFFEYDIRLLEHYPIRSFTRFICFEHTLSEANLADALSHSLHVKCCLTVLHLLIELVLHLLLDVSQYLLNALLWLREGTHSEKSCRFRVQVQWGSCIIEVMG